MCTVLHCWSPFPVTTSSNYISYQRALGSMSSRFIVVWKWNRPDQETRVLGEQKQGFQDLDGPRCAVIQQHWLLLDKMPRLPALLHEVSGFTITYFQLDPISLWPKPIISQTFRGSSQLIRDRWFLRTDQSILQFISLSPVVIFACLVSSAFFWVSR